MSDDLHAPDEFLSGAYNDRGFHIVVFWYYVAGGAMSDDMDIYSRTFWSISPEKMIFKQNPFSNGPTKVTSSIFNSQNTLLKILFYYHSGTSHI